MDSEREDVRFELLRQLKASGQLQHAWLMQVWQGEHDLQPAAMTLLAELARTGEARPSDLARQRMVDVSVVSRQIAQLTAAGLVERRPAPRDGRAALLRVSAEGRAQLGRLRERSLRLMAEVLGDWDDDLVVDLTVRLAELNEGLRSAIGDRSPCANAAG